ncbi:MAG: zinc-ribbon domain-containing protein [Candidatus Hodarchaeales archaeon]|jgi:uncharacterized membrane protein YvbJ
MEVSPKICPNCGTEVDAHENFCMKCGWVQDEKKVKKGTQASSEENEKRRAII